MSARTIAGLAALVSACSAGPAPHPGPRDVVASVAVTPAAPPPPRSVKILKRYPKVGDKQTSRAERGVRVHLDMLMKDRPISMDLETSVVSDLDEECIAVESNRCAEIKVAVRKYETIESVGGPAKEKPSPIAGKTYLVDLRTSERIVKSVDGTKVPDDERKAIADEYKTLLGQRLLESLPERDVAVGERLELDDLISNVELSTRDLDIQGGKPTFTVSGIRDVGGEPTLLVDMDASFGGEGKEFGRLHGTAKGTVTIRANGARPTSMIVDGTFEAENVKDGMPMKVFGKMKTKASWTYSW